MSYSMNYYDDDYGGGYDERDDRLATMSEAVVEWSYNCEAPSDVEWLLHDYDVWVKNPRYVGKPGPHPEDDMSQEEFDADQLAACLRDIIASSDANCSDSLANAINAARDLLQAQGRAGDSFFSADFPPDEDIPF